MKLLEKIKPRIWRLVMKRFSPVRWKQSQELSFWKEMKATEGNLGNSHYEQWYTSHFGLNGSYYENKCILDIGCGPCGSLEWASMASRRVGLDPLANDYHRLGADQHQMEYISSGSENISMCDGECDAVFSFNSLDHVDDVDKTIEEIKRVTRPGGIFLLIVEVNHPPTDCEPHDLTPKILIETLKPEFVCKSLDVYKQDDSGIYQSIFANQKISQPETTREIGVLSAKFERAALT